MVESTLIRNLRRLMTEAGLNQKSLAKKAKLNETAIRDILKGKSKSPTHETLQKISVALGCTTPDLTGEVIPRRQKFALARPPEDVTQVQEVDALHGAGIGGEAPWITVPSGKKLTISEEVVRTNWGLPTEYLRSELHVPPDAAFILELRGDSMQPTLFSGDRVMANTKDKLPSPPGIFALWDGFGLTIKRLEILVDRDEPTVRLISDNPLHSPQERTLGEINIIGRIVWVARRI